MGSDVPSWIELTQSPPGRVWSGDDWVIFEGRWQDCPPAEVDHVISDPPYDERTHAGGRRGTGRSGKNTTICAKRPIGFEPIDPGAIVGGLLSRCRRWLVAFCAVEQLGAYAMAGGAAYIRSGAYVKTNPTPQFSGDRPAQWGDGIALLHRKGRKRWNGGGKTLLLTAARGHHYRADRVHETQKPLALMRQLVEDFTDRGEVVWDPYAGSATTGVACLQLGRRFIGHELQAHYAEIAAERLQAAAQGLTLRDARAGQIPLFGGSND